MYKNIFCVLFLLLFSISVGAQNLSMPDSLLSTRESTTQFHTKQLILPTVLITVGALGTSHGWVADLNHEINKPRQKLHDKGVHCHFDDVMQIVPMTAHLGLEFVGMRPKHSFNERFLTSVTAAAFTVGIAKSLKHITSELRPDGSDHYSFPSGHTSIAFAGAELSRMEYGTTGGICAYTAATLTAMMRMYNQKHWFGDVVAGAGVGILSARIAHWLLPFERRILGMDRSDSNLVFVPTYDCSTGSAGVAMAWVF